MFKTGGSAWIIMIPVSTIGKIEHASYHRVGEEFGFDMLIRVPKNQAINSLGEIMLEKIPLSGAGLHNWRTMNSV